MLKDPISIRKGIPFYCEKSDKAYRQDPYEHYHEMVRRQVITQYYELLTDHHNPYEPLISYIHQHIHSKSKRIAEIGCGIGKVARSIADTYPHIDIIGLDYSYQMIKLAHDLHIKGKAQTIDLIDKGFKSLTLQHDPAENLQLGVAQAENLPFEDERLDMIFSLFLLDRLKNPKSFFAEMNRCLAQGGKMVIISPLNFNQSNNWSQYYPLSELIKTIESNGFDIIDSNDTMLIKEPLDVHNNHICWNCIALTAQKV